MRLRERGVRIRGVELLSVCRLIAILRCCCLVGNGARVFLFLLCVCFALNG